MLVRELVKMEAQVKVIMTKSATDFISPLTLGTLSKNEVAVSYVSNKEAGVWTNHVDLGLWADLMLIAPATANTISKMVHGACDNVLLASYLSAKCPVMLAPAMDLDMHLHPSTQLNLQQLKSYGNHIIDPEEGELASGLYGKGRMAEPLSIAEAVNKHFQKEDTLNGKKVLITAGPTYEPIDPVRFIGNFSSGKMGVALALEAAKRGAEVQLILGPSSLHPQHKNIHITHVQTAVEMKNACDFHFKNSDIIIAAAAVADYRPADKADQKIKKEDGGIQSIELIENPDILSSLGKQKLNQVLIGFALETTNEEENAKKKLLQKNLDFIVLNSLNHEGAGFAGDTNKITILSHNNSIAFELKSKSEAAADIFDTITNG